MLDITDPEVKGRVQNFIIFEPASQRVKDIDILIKGPELAEMFYAIQSKLEVDDDLSKVILYNKINKIGRMLDLVTNYDAIIMTKFLDRIWRRYSYLSNLGESFLDLNTFLSVFPEYNEKLESILALRLDEDDEDEDEDKGHPELIYHPDLV